MDKKEEKDCSRVGGRDISFNDRMLNTILGTPENGIRFYTKNKRRFDPNLYIGDHIGVGKIYNKHTFKRMRFSRNKECTSVIEGQDYNDESDEDDEGNEGQEAVDVDNEEK
ncbi:hypothetical protein M9H77_30077 [Catharanthus roseus]|uniref:Uncharacterized protein n=1 Tax=Catharanthus roseus TaxID=4058 RepID=A0ACB9ZXA1_CATRO|nr:hypothetical protein M9H77_30077 [Catharanthus roseus]